MAKKIIPWELIIARLKEEMSNEDKLFFGEWHNQPGNQQLFDELKLLWERIREESAGYEPDVSLYWKKMELRMVKKRRRSFSRLAIAASFAVFIALSATIWIMSGNPDAPDAIQTYSSLNGKSKIALPDGSIVWLNKGSTLSYPVSFARNRNLQLKGEAWFDVKKDKKHPFVVSTSDIRIKVHGTQFNIDSYDTNKSIRVALNHGSISLINRDKELLLKPGELATYQKSDHSVTIESGDVVFESSWAKDTWHFNRKSLGHICEYLEQWYKVKIEVDESLKESHFYTFTLRDEPLESILRIMNRINPINYSFGEDDVVRIKNVKP